MRMGDKLGIHKLLQKDTYLAPYLPETYPYTEESLKLLLGKYQGAVIKPLISPGGGHGIIKLVATNQGTLQTYIENKKSTFNEYTIAENYIRSTANTYSKKYIVQQPISLISVDEKPLDFRILAQRKKGQEWLITGRYAKLAPEGYFVTNLVNNGRLLTVEEVSQLMNIPRGKSEEALTRMEEITLRIVQRLSRVFWKRTLWGLDMGLDSKGMVWFIEANPYPGLGAFRNMKNQSMHNLIQSILEYNQHKKS